jgi:hypothetical protein
MMPRPVLLCADGEAHDTATPPGRRLPGERHALSPVLLTPPLAGR